MGNMTYMAAGQGVHSEFSWLGTVSVDDLWIGGGNKELYGGVRLDGRLACEYAHKVAHPASADERDASFFAVMLMVTDLPFSAIADTVTLPITIWNVKRTQPPVARSDGNDPLLRQ